MKAIFKKELRSFFLSMTGYALIAFSITFVGIYFMIYNIGYGYPYFAYTLSGVMLILLVLVPVITMRSFAEEKKNRTDQLAARPEHCNQRPRQLFGLERDEKAEKGGCR